MAEDTNKIKRIIFIGGSGRSGTTMVQAMLNAHKDIFGGPEFGYLGKICELRDLIDSSTNPINKLDVYFSKEELNKKFHDFVLRLLEQPCLYDGKKIISEKSPNNAIVFSDLVKIFPHAKYLFVIRDPRAIYSSFKDIKRRAKINKADKLKIPGYSKNINMGIEYINKCWKSGFEFINAYPEKSLVLVYEDIVCDPQRATKKICDFIGIEWDSQMLNYTEKMEKIVKKNEISIWGGSQMYHKNIHMNSIDKWRQNLSQSEIGIIQKKIYMNSYIENRYFKEKNNESISVITLFHLLIFNLRESIYSVKKSLIIFLKKISKRIY